MKDRIKELLGCGIAPEIVASAVGVSAGYVSQLLAEPEFANEVQELKLLNLTGLVERDKKWDTLEDKLLDRLEHTLPMLNNPMQVVTALRTVNGAHRRAVTKDPGNGHVKEIVHLHLPACLNAQFVVNQTNQVVSVEGRSIATMPANAVVEKLKTLRANSLESEAISQQQDREKANERLSTIKKLTHLPVHELL
jgi:hypothetical protein